MLMLMPKPHVCNAQAKGAAQLDAFYAWQKQNPDGTWTQWRLTLKPPRGVTKRQWQQHVARGEAEENLTR